MNSVATRQEPDVLSFRQIIVIFSGLILAVMLAALDSTIVTPALPTIVGELGGFTHLSWVVTAYLLAQTIVTPIYGKLGDLYGRKIVLQVAIVLFLFGSVICGTSQTMNQLILFRWIQGLGGGGLMVTTQAVVGDIVSPRQRGRYQGIFGAVFGLASVAGPLIGGYFTKYWTWRWIFYINLPVGALALGVLAVTLPGRSQRVQHRIDVAGASLFAIVLSALILVADLGGTEYAWNSPLILGLLATIVIASGLFVIVEHFASEPVLPLRLFANSTFRMTTILSMVVGFALWGSVTYLPTYLQVVREYTPTSSGMQLLPIMGGMLTMSIISGQIISRTGRYKVFPISGMLLMSLGMYLISQMPADVGLVTASFYFLLLGLGMGMVMQVLVIAVQNAVPYRDLGVATSGAILFRLIGGSIGTAVLGTLFAAQLHHHLERLAPANDMLKESMARITPEALLKMPQATREIYLEAFVLAFSSIFLLSAVVATVGFLLAWLIPELPLKHSIAESARTHIGEEAGETFDMPHDPEAAPRQVNS
jgi:EmrB/QacA subfamily drug resistance transporter